VTPDPRKPRRIRRILAKATLALAITTLLVILGLWGHSASRIPSLFRLNKECQEEGYYMAEFEFKMLGIIYLLDHGQYAKAVSSVERLHGQLKTRKGLVKVPKLADKGEEMDFYLGLQNPRTGAFMDDSYPYCTWEGPTGNVLEHLEKLSKETGRRLQLRYPLKFFDRIDTLEELQPYLDDLGHIGWVASKLPESSFHFVRGLLSYASEGNLVERNHLYAFSPEWKRALLQWVYQNQDPETGYWGPRFRHGRKLTKRDLDNTGSIAKAFVDNKGNDRYSEFPLRHKDRMFQTTLDVMAEPHPGDTDDLDQWHAWTLREGKGIALLTRYLWKDASPENKAHARETFESLLRLKYEKYYVPSEGAFSYYPGSQHATLDGTGSALGNLDDAGSFSAAKQRRIWGDPHVTCANLGQVAAATLTEADLAPLRNAKGVNSFRYYRGAPDPDDFTARVEGVFYTGDTLVLDLVELAPGLKAWAGTTMQSLGNWTSRQEVLEELSRVHTGRVPVSRGGIPLDRLNEALQGNGTVTVVGFDLFQVPVCRIIYTRP
jgi:hypothetical protein